MRSIDLTRIVRSTINIDMLDPTTLMPIGNGSACIIRYEDFSSVFTVAHVTDIENAAACIPTGHKAKTGWSKLYSVGALNYLAKFNKDRFYEQLELLKSDSLNKEELDFGQLDLSFTRLKEPIEILQHSISYQSPKVKVKAGNKLTIESGRIVEPSQDKEYAFSGRVKALFFKSTLQGNLFETCVVLYDKLRFTRRIGHYFEFELPDLITEHADFIGTSGAPVMDKEGNVVALITHGYEGTRFIYGIALVDFYLIAEEMMKKQ